ncbi:hypothetical protein LPJ66_002315 [Kickxella alabastrina]|uniref:Uncharacterized protein n=1 Tax=Kickxella alabastrina TaxID=61397 RepID=A0ACC1IQU9_9FUNG|nr:hypothetical protein LPJ66_002315 [Kickxella alabastrina]
MGATNPRSGNGNVTAAYNLIQQQQHMRPSSGRPSAPTATYQNTNINIAGVVVGQAPQPHPALIQPQIPTARKRKTNKLTATTPTAASASASAATTVAGGAADSAMDDSVSGDEIDVQPYAVAVGRYQNNHNLMSEIFVALPNSAVELPRHYYEELDRVVVERDLGRLEVEAKECERAHAERVEAVERGRGEFRGVMEELARAGAGDVDMVRAKLADVLGMEFVDNPFRTMERVPVDRVDAVEGAVYKQL